MLHLLPLLRASRLFPPLGATSRGAGRAGANIRPQFDGLRSATAGDGRELYVASVLPSIRYPLLKWGNNRFPVLLTCHVRSL